MTTASHTCTASSSTILTNSQCIICISSATGNCRDGIRGRKILTSTIVRVGMGSHTRDPTRNHYNSDQQSEQAATYM